MSGDQFYRGGGGAASLFTLWVKRERELLDKECDQTLAQLVEKAVLRRRKESDSAKQAERRDLSLANETCHAETSQSQGRPQAQTRVGESLQLETQGKGQQGRLQQLPRKSALPYAGVFIYKATKGQVKTVTLQKEDYSWLEEAGKVVHLACQTRSSEELIKDEEHLMWQTQVLFDNFVRSHCYTDSQAVCSPRWLLTRMFQCYCLTADVPLHEVEDSVVAEHTEKCCLETYECSVKEGRTWVKGLAVYSDSPLYTLWASKAVIVKAKKRTRDARVKKTKSFFTRCVLVHPREAMSAIRLFRTDAGDDSTTAKFVAKAVATKLLNKHYCHFRELNRMEFGHVMCKGNHGIQTVRPVCRIKPQSRRNKQEYHYGRVAPRTVPLHTRAELGTAILQRGFRLPRRQKLHLLRNAQLHTSNYSSGDGDACVSHH